MPLHEVVIGEVQPNRSHEVLALLAESQCQAGETAHVKPRGSVQPLHVAGGDQVNIGVASHHMLLRGDTPDVL